MMEPLQMTDIQKDTFCLGRLDAESLAHLGNEE